MENKILNSKYPFEAYLKKIHADQYIGIDDEMADDFQEWIRTLDEDELVEYANVFSKVLINTFITDELRNIRDCIRINNEALNDIKELIFENIKDKKHE